MKTDKNNNTNNKYKGTELLLPIFELKEVGTLQLCAFQLLWREERCVKLSHIILRSLVSILASYSQRNTMAKTFEARKTSNCVSAVVFVFPPLLDIVIHSQLYVRPEA